ncbi:hypothetical protein LTR17_003578 [Elasticomyces elasticus]|nr:hypothetical protein LTR17_003578 [Elasticomyces elasticus]
MDPSPSRPIRLLNIHTYSLVQPHATKLPYAILSHRWGSDEVSYTEWEGRNHGRIRDRQGYAKIRGACEQAKRDGLEYLWVDTICINKPDNSELSESINSMYAWYQNAAVPGRMRCYALLSDVGGAAPFEEGEHSFQRSAWFTRGWTLQELLAPRHVVFFAKDWSSLGDLRALLRLVAGLTKIPEAVLRGDTALHACTIAQRLSWASGRVTQRIEDQTYALLGILDVHMHLNYGEGWNAFVRLQNELVMKHNGLTVLAWASQDRLRWPRLFASSPADFASSAAIEATISMPVNAEYSLNNVGLTGLFPVVEQENSDSENDILIPLYCHLSARPEEMLALRLKASPTLWRTGPLTCSVDATQVNGNIVSLFSRLATTRSFNTRSVPKAQLTIRHPAQVMSTMSTMSTSRSEGNLKVHAQSANKNRGQDTSSAAGIVRRPVSQNFSDDSDDESAQPGTNFSNEPYTGIATSLGAFAGAAMGVMAANAASSSHRQGQQAGARPHLGRTADMHHEADFAPSSGADAPALAVLEDRPNWLYSESANRWYGWSESRNAYVWEDGTLASLIVQEQLQVPSPSSTGARSIAKSTSNDHDPSTATRNQAELDRTRTDESTVSLDHLTLAPRDKGQTQRSKGRFNATEPEVSDLRDVGRGVREFTATDKDTGVQTNWRIGPAQDVGERPFVPKTICGSDDGDGTSVEEEDRRRGSSGKARARPRTRVPRRNYTFGQVIELLLVPPPPTRSSEISSTVTIRSGAPGTSEVRGGAHAAVRRFVVVQPATDTNFEFSAIPIRTYDGEGVAGRDETGRPVVKAHHAVVYTANPIQPPAPHPTDAERPRFLTKGAREPGMQPIPILVDELDRIRPLHPMSRLDFFDVHNFDTSLQNIRVYGDVSRDSQAPLRTQYMAVQASKNRSTAQQGRPPGPPGPPPGPAAPRSTQEPGSGYVERPMQQASQTSAPTTDVSAISTAVHSNAAVPVNVFIAYLNNLYQTVTARGLEAPPALTQEQLRHFAENSTDRLKYLSGLRSNYHRQQTGPARRG